jgi:hypothetical protein
MTPTPLTDERFSFADGKMRSGAFFCAPGIVRRWVGLFRVGGSRRGDGYDPAEDRGTTRCSVEFKNRVRSGALGRHCPGRIRT